jgi:hypothetical protein
MSEGSERPLRPGDIVEVRPAAEILATLDAEASLDAVPFMPEMLQYVGRRFTVSRRVEKICDTISATGSRRMHDTVYLENLRCDGSGHGGCQAGCRIYWKEAWLRRVDGRAHMRHPENHGADELEEEGARGLDQRTDAGTRTVRETEGSAEVWRCQATEALKATEPLKTSDIRQYWRELRSGNYGLLRFLRVAIPGFVSEIAGRLHLVGPVPLTGKGTYKPPAAPLNLQPGDLVQVRDPDEIAGTLDENGLLRGLSFDREMLPYCGRTLRVKDRVQRIIDDRTGRMIEIPSDCLILEGAVCSGERSHGRWFCPREIYPYWREAWLRPMPEPSKTEDPRRP